MRFLLEKINGYLLLNSDGKKYLLDTGAPWSFSDDGKIGDLRVAVRPLAGIQREVAAGIGCPVHGLLGFDGSYGLRITDSEAELLPPDYPLPECARFLPYTRGLHVEVELNGHPVRMLVDTGCFQAVTAFPELLDGCPETGRYRDWLAMAGKWQEIVKYQAEFKFPCGFAFRGEIGVLEDYARFFRNDGIAGTLGNDLLERFNLFFHRTGVALLNK